jgi:hypothetical protein
MFPPPTTILYRYTAFSFGFPAPCKRTSKPVARDCLLTNFNSGQPAAPVGRHPFRPGKSKRGSCLRSEIFFVNSSMLFAVSGSTVLHLITRRLKICNSMKALLSG